MAHYPTLESNSHLNRPSVANIPRITSTYSNDLPVQMLLERVHVPEDADGAYGALDLCLCGDVPLAFADVRLLVVPLQVRHDLRDVLRGKRAEVALVFAAVVPGLPVLHHEGGRVHRLALSNQFWWRRRRGHLRTLQPRSLGRARFVGISIGLL